MDITSTLDRILNVISLFQYSMLLSPEGWHKFMEQISETMAMLLKFR